jgi:hypothetical protein
MSYNFNGIPNISPVGTVIQYAGTTDPPGWAICDGTLRSNASGKYNNVLTSQLANVPNANTTILTAPFNGTASLPDTIISERLCASQNGNIMVFTNYNPPFIFISNNRGATWYKYITGVSTSRIGVALSNSGSVIATIATISASIIISTNYGYNFNTVPITGFGEGAGSLYTSSILISGDGQKLLVASSLPSNILFYSPNTGTNWSVIYDNGSGISNVFSTLCMSNDGNVFAFTTNNFTVYISTTFGASWITTLPSGNATTPGNKISTLSLSSDGKYILIGGRSANIYLSSDTGTNWRSISNVTNGSLPTLNSTIWSTASMSLSGKNMIIFDFNSQAMFLSSNSGNWWSSPNVTIPGSFVGFAGVQCCMLASGTILYSSGYSAGPYLSTNYGYNWAKFGTAITAPNYMPQTSTGFGVPNTFGWQQNCLSMSETGQVMAASSQSTTYQGVYVSTNSGTNWKRTNGGSLGTTVGVDSISMTLKGSVMVACSNNLMHISTNYGVNWRQLSAPVLNYSICCISGNGNVIIGVPFKTGNSAALSSNGGNTFSMITINSQSSSNLSTFGRSTDGGNTIFYVTFTQGGRGISMNRDGSVIVMSGNLSTDSGATWSDFVRGGNGFSISNDGTKILLGVPSSYGGGLGTFLYNPFLKANFGNSISNPGWLNVCAYCVSMSGDGTFMVAVDYTNSIYLSTNTGNYWIDLANYSRIPTSTTPIISISMSNDGTKILAAASDGQLFVSNTAFSLSEYYSSFIPINLPISTTVDGTTLNYIVKY